MKSETRHLIISGHVQGVGYRSSLRREARARHIDGWVRNLADGRVEALLSGTPFALESLLDWARQGPPDALVEDIQNTPSPNEHAPPPAGSGFEILH